LNYSNELENKGDLQSQPNSIDVHSNTIETRNDHIVGMCAHAFMFMRKKCHRSSYWTHIYAL